MKKFCKFLLLIVLAFSMLFSVACDSFINQNELPNNNEQTEQGNQDDDKKEENKNVAYSSSYTTKTDLPSSATLSENVVIKENTISRTEAPSTISKAYEKVKGSAVAIYISTASGLSAGSGTIVDLTVDGKTENNVFYILTCYHVIGYEGATINVYVPDANGINYGQKGYDAEHYGFAGTIGGVDNSGKIDLTKSVTLVGADKDSDVGVLRLYVKDNAVATEIAKHKAKIMDTKYDVKVADEIFLLGNPTGEYPGWYTHGDVAYVYAESNIENIGEMTLYGLNIDAWHGSSGGGVYNLYGEVIGILNSGSDTNSGMNFAIPLKIDIDGVYNNGFVNIMKQLIGSKTDSNYGYISGRKEKFGFTVSSDTISSIPYIVSVTSGSLASTVGLKANDVITGIKVNDNEKVNITEYQQFIEIMNSLQIGDTMVLSITRTTIIYNGMGIARDSKKESKDIALTVYQSLFCNTGA